MKYLVMACHTGYAVVLDEDGAFSRSPTGATRSARR